MEKSLDNIRTIYCNLPNTIKSFTVATPDDWFTIVLNENLSHEQNMISYNHEINHIIRGDFNKSGPVELIEIAAHN